MPKIKGVFHRPKNVDSNPVSRDMMQHIRRHFPVNNGEVIISASYAKYFDALSVAEGLSPQMQDDAKEIRSQLGTHGDLVFFQRELTVEERRVRRAELANTGENGNE